MPKESPTCIHSLGVIKKKDSNKIRPITDCSHPKLLSVNQHMSQVYGRFKYISIDQIIAQIVEATDTSLYLSTIDLANAYRSVLIRPSNHQYFGLSLESAIQTIFYVLAPDQSPSYSLASWNQCVGHLETQV